MTSGAFCRAMEGMNLGFGKDQIARMLRRLDAQRLGYVPAGAPSDCGAARWQRFESVWR